MGIVSTIREKCRRCYTCVRECPAKAIKVEGGQATVIDERCIACGNCVKVCAQQAKRIQDSIGEVNQLLAGPTPVFACLAPSFPAAFHPLAPAKVIAGVRRLGFAQVWEVAFGAELISRRYTALFEATRRERRPVVATPCPAIVAYVEKYMPALHEMLAPIVSPMIAIARAIRQRHGREVRIVFIGPCIAKKNEIRDPHVAGTVDVVLTYKELTRMWEAAGIQAGELPDSDFDGPRAYIGRTFPISGGLLKTAGLSADILENDILVTEGKDRVLSALRELAAGESRALFFDVLFCEGCISGPKMLNDLGVFVRKEILADYVQARNRSLKPEHVAASLQEFGDLNLERGFTPQNLILPQPSEEEIAKALQRMRKFRPEDQLNCGACGYPTCREKAVAVCQGLAEPEMCLPYLVEELQATCVRLEQSHRELASAQERLLQTERLASMGQLSAGIAHELNNPLGTVLLYSHMLLKELQEPRVRADLQLILNEALRCKNIVRGLLDFARQSRVAKAPTRLEEVAHEVMTIMAPRAREAQVQLVCNVAPDLPTAVVDRGQVVQMLVNLVQNGIDACSKGGVVRLSMRQDSKAGTVEISVSDNGCGIPPAHLSHLFTPFFTTKQTGKGTGLGLAIVYGIVKMHSGDISVQSEPGKGSTFTVTLPLGTETAAVACDVGPEAKA